MKKHAKLGFVDRHGILDNCHRCGAPARWHGSEGAVYVQCYECAESIDTCASRDEAMVAWNTRQRKVRRK